jgi:hypothetical protein
VDWIHLGTGFGQLGAVVKKVMNLRAPENAGNFLTIQWQEGIYFMEL